MNKTAAELVKRMQSPPGRKLMLCCMRDRLDVFFIETPVVIRGRSPIDKLRGFVQRTIQLMDAPDRYALAGFLHLPLRIVDDVLADLTKTGLASIDSGGCWTIPEGSAIVGVDDTNATLDVRCRKLLCYWQGAEVLLPVLPSTLRERDLTLLKAHKLEDEARVAYERIRCWSGKEGANRGKPESLVILPPPPLLVAALPPDEASAPWQCVSDESGIAAPEPQSLGPDSIHVRHCQIDVICLGSLCRQGAIWKLQSRLWSRARHPEFDNEDGPFTPGEPFDGWPLLDRLLNHGIGDGSDVSKQLAGLFDPTGEDWRRLIASAPDADRIRRPVEDDPDDCMLLAPDIEESRTRWKLIDTTLGPHLKLLGRNPHVR